MDAKQKANPVEVTYYEEIKLVTPEEWKKLDRYVARMKRRHRGAKFGANDPLLPDEGVLNANE